MAEEIQEQVEEVMHTDSEKECELCGAKEVQVKRVESETYMAQYITDCPADRCGSRLAFIHFHVGVGDLVPIIRDDFETVSCSNPECEPKEHHLKMVVENEEPQKRTEYVLPIKGIITTTIHEHHMSYVPEETMMVCSTCHAKIHHNDDFRPDLQPDMKRKEWEAMINDE